MRPERLTHPGRAHRHSYDHVTCAARAKHARRGSGGHSRRQPVVHEDHVSSGHVDHGQLASVASATPLELRPLARDHSLELGARHAERPHRAGVDHDDAALAERPDAELRLTRRTQLAHQPDVERRAERRSHLIAHRHAAARQRDHHRRLERELRKARGQRTTRMPPIAI